MDEKIRNGYQNAGTKYASYAKAYDYKKLAELREVVVCK